MSSGASAAPADAGPRVALAARDLRMRFAAGRGEPVEALQPLSLDARRGEVLGLVGPDGAGKTTLLRLAAGLLVPSGGTLHVLGLDSVGSTLEIRGRIGYMPQRFGLYQDLTVQENLDLYGDLQGVPQEQRRLRTPRLMQMTGLGPFLGRLAGQLSGGMKQKLGLACSLIKSPELLLLDEPTVGVDPVSRRELWSILDELVRSDGIAVVVSTAYLDEAERCDRLIVLQGGVELARGTPAELRAAAAERVFLLATGGQRAARRAQRLLVGAPGVVDATLRSGKVRVVTTERGPEAARAALGDAEGVLEPASPCFEDAFLLRVHAHAGAGRARSSSAIPALAPLAPTDGQVVVAVEGLCKRFGAFEAVKDVSFEVRAGEIFGLLGPNGAGKSTTFRMLCGLLAISAGEVRVAGRDLRRAAAAARARLGYMAQQFSLYGSLTVRENLTFFGRAYGLSRQRLRERLDWAATEFKLSERLDQTAGTLPGGYKQRLAMAAALLHEPEILFLDEPTSGVDPLARREFWLRINAVAERGVTVVVTTHFMEEAEYCDRMLVMSQGETLAMGTPAEIRGLARTPERPDPTIEDAFIALAEGTAITPPASEAGA